MSVIMLKNIEMPKDFGIPAKISDDERAKDNMLFEKAKECLKKHNAKLIAHYYTAPAVQRLAEEADGFIGDSLEMARVGKECDSQILVVAGVRFMGESAKILSPEKTVLMPDMGSECSLDLCCKATDLARLKKEHPNSTVVAYANTSAEVKSMADWIVTSSLAVSVADYLKSRGEEILWIPDHHLGTYIASNAKSDIYCWPGRCIVHDSFDAPAIAKQKEAHPGCKVLVHPESPANVVALADRVGSTSQLLSFAQSDDAQTYIVATERGIFYKMQQACPNKTFIEAATTVRENIHLDGAKCPWMELNSMAKIIECLEGNDEVRAAHSVQVKEEIRVNALKPLERMLRFAAALKAGTALPRDL